MSENEIKDYPAIGPSLTDKILCQTAAGQTSYTTWGDVYQWARIYEYSSTGVPGIVITGGGAGNWSAYVAYAKRAGAPVTTPLTDTSFNNGITVDVASTSRASFTIASDGIYRCTAHISFKYATADKPLQFTWFKNASSLETLGMTGFRTVPSATAIGNTSPGGDIECAAGDVLDIRLRSFDQSASTYTCNLYVVSLNVYRIGSN